MRAPILTLLAGAALAAPAHAQIRLDQEPVQVPALTDVFPFTHNYSGPNTGQTSNATLQSILNKPGSTQYLPFSGGTVTGTLTSSGSLAITGSASIAAGRTLTNAGTISGGVVSGDVSQSTTTAAGTGTVAITNANRAAQVVNVLDYGVDPTGVADSTAGFQAAVATGKSVHVPCGTYLLSSAVTLSSTAGQRLYGEGMCSQITVPTTFSSSASGVFILAGDPAYNGQISDLQITFAQPPDLALTTQS